jgi:predicted ABC-type ATPase
MDPCSGGIPITEQRKRHQRYIDDLQKALTTCKNEVFIGWDDNFDNYEWIIAKGSYSTTKR